jgi:hypothetical protein
MCEFKVKVAAESENMVSLAGYGTGLSGGEEGT